MKTAELNIEQQKQIINQMELCAQKGLIPALVFDRVSTERQGDTGFSLEYQREKSGLYAKHMHLQIIHIFEIAESARISEERQKFQLLLRTAVKYDIKNIIFRCGDRMARNHKDLDIIEKLIDKENYQIHFYEGSGKILNKKSSPEERLFLGVEISFAKFQSDKTSSYVLSTNQHKARQGVAPIPVPPIGYMYDKDIKKHVIDPQYQNTVRYMFDTYDAEKMSLQELADSMNAKGLKTRNGGKWTTSSLHQTLSSIFYTGQFLYHKELHMGTHDPYISVQRFESRLERMGVKYMGARKRDKDFAFARMLKFKGKLLTGEMKKNQYVYYTNRAEKISFREEDVLDAVDRNITALEFSPQFGNFLEQLFRDTVGIKEKNHEHELKGLSAEIVRLNAENKKLVEYLFDGFDPETIRSKMQENRDIIKRFENRRQKLVVNTEEFIFEVSHTIERCRNLPFLYKKSTGIEKASMIRNIADEIVLDGESASIVWKSPFSYILRDVLENVPAEVRKRTEMHAIRDDFRTSVNQISQAWQRRFAA